MKHAQKTVNNLINENIYISLKCQLIKRGWVIQKIDLLILCEFTIRIYMCNMGPTEQKYEIQNEKNIYQISKKLKERQQDLSNPATRHTAIYSD